MFVPRSTLLVISALTQAVLTTEMNWTIDLPGSLTVQQGLCAIVPCNFQHMGHVNTTQIQVSWYKLSQVLPNRTITEQDSVHQEYKSVSGLNSTMMRIDCSLRISPTTDQNTGIYQVTIQLSETNMTYQSSSLNLTITGAVKPDISSMGIIVENNLATLSCTFRDDCGEPGVNLTWINITSLNLSAPVGESYWDKARSLINSSVSFLASAEDNGKLIGCLINYPNASLQSLQTLLLDVKYGPDIPEMQQVTVREMESVQVECVVNSNPVSTISWYRGNESILSAVNDTLYLNIDNITPRGSSVYTCQARNGFGEAERKVNIIVQYPPTISWMGVSVGVLEGQSFRTDCVVDSFPTSNTSWARGGRLLNESVSNTLTLVIPEMREEDTALYTCSSVNPFGNTSQLLDIRLEYAPRNISVALSRNETLNLTIEMSEGEPLSVLCWVDSAPAANLSWTVNGELRDASERSNSLWLIIANLTYREHGAHTCTAQNRHGRSQTSLNVILQFSPKEVSVIALGAGSGIREGDNVTLACRFRSHPPPLNYTWYRRVPGNTVETIALNETVTLRSVTRRDVAHFICSVSNAMGTSDSAPFLLDTEYGPEISEDSECARRAEGFTCVCVTYSNPPGDITWHLPHANLSGNQTQGSFVSWQLREGHLVTGSLILTGLQDEEEVTVSCSIRNPHGTGMFTVYLWVKAETSVVNLVLAVIAGALAMLVAFLLLCLIITCTQSRRMKLAVIDETEMEELTVQREAVRTVSVVQEREEEMEAEGDGEDEGEEEDTESKPEDEGSKAESVKQMENGDHAPVSEDQPEVELHYACIDFSKSRSSDGIVGHRDSTQYAEIKPQ